MPHNQLGGDRIELSVVQDMCCNETDEMGFTAGMRDLLLVLQVEVGSVL